MQPYGIFDRQMTYISMMSKTYLREGRATRATTRSPVGTGPYSLVRWVKDDRTELRANPNYWNGEPAIKNAVFRPDPVRSEPSCRAALG